MALRDKFSSKAAAAALAAGLLYGAPAAAQETQPEQPAAPETTIIMAQQGEQPAESGWSFDDISLDNFSVETAPLIPYAPAAALAVIALGLGGLALARRQKGSLTRAAFYGLAAYAIMNPQFYHQEREPLSTEVAVVIDKSPSQNIDGRAQTTAAMREELLEELKRKIPGATIRVIEAGQSVDADGTHLFEALDRILSDIAPERLGACYMLTDGQVHDIPVRPDARPCGGAPLHVGVSGKEGEIDRRIVFEQAPLYGIVDEEIDFKIRVIDSGVDTSGPVRVTVKADGETVAVRDVTPGQTEPVRLKVPHGGPNLFELEAQTLEGELTTANNSIVAEVQGLRDRLRVLLLSGNPAQSERVWRNILKSDPALDLVHFTILRPPHKQDGTVISELALVAFPSRELFLDKIEEFDLVVLDRFDNRNGIMQRSYMESVATYVENGGALLAVSGPEFAPNRNIYDTPLGKLLPTGPNGSIAPEKRIVEELYKPLLTEDGDRHPVTRGLTTPENEDPSWGHWSRLMESGEIKGSILMEGPGEKPLLVVGEYGEGRVAHLLSDSYYLWARGFEGGGPFIPLLQKLVHWSMKQYDLEEEALRMTTEKGNLVIERQTMSDVTGPVTLHLPSGLTETVELAEEEPGIFRARIPAPEAGLYRAEQEAGSMFSFTHAGADNSREFRDPRATTEFLAPIAGQTGGSASYMKNEGGNLEVPSVEPREHGEKMAGDGWTGIRMTEASTLKSVSQASLPAWLVLAFAGAALGAAFYRESGGKISNPFKKGKTDGPAPEGPQSPAL